MASPLTLFESLQREFCPPLDSSLLAALLVEIESDANGNPLSPSDPQITNLRTTLQELAAQADESQLFEFSDQQSPDETSSTPDFYHGTTATTSTLGSDSSGSSTQSFSSPLGFLQAILPHVPLARLRAALVDAEEDERDVDMWDVVANILTAESVREMEERGLDGLDEDERLANLGRDEEISWETIELKKSRGAAAKSAKKKKKTCGSKITVVDVRQQQNRPVFTRKTGVPKHATSDPWTQLSSVSAHLATLLPPHPASFFQSYFHSPDYSTPYDALCSALTSIYSAQSSSSPDEYTDILFGLLDILLPEYECLKSDQRSRLISDTELSLYATEGRGDDALDLVKLLRELDSDSATGYFEMGVYHLPVPSLGPKSPKLPSAPPPMQPPPSKMKLKPPSVPKASEPDPYQWQFVPPRKVPNHAPHPLSLHIPAYNRDVNGIKVRGSGNGFGKGGKGDVGEMNDYRSKAGESTRKQKELLREATKMWQRGNSKTRGGEIAFYFAERAREFQELAKTEALNVARARVEAKRMASNDPGTVDLHGTTVAEATVIVKEILQTYPTSLAKPLKIITGRGAHSANQVSVLKPAIKKALVEEGWSVGTWDGGLIVRGKQGGRSA